MPGLVRWFCAMDQKTRSVVVWYLLDTHTHFLGMSSSGHIDAILVARSDLRRKGCEHRFENYPALCLDLVHRGLDEKEPLGLKKLFRPLLTISEKIVLWNDAVLSGETSMCGCLRNLRFHFRGARLIETSKVTSAQIYPQLSTYIQTLYDQAATSLDEKSE